jgi:hypothetical protein
VLCTLLLALAAASCATAPHPLLEADPSAMNDVTLLRYYYDLGEAIDQCEQSSQGDTTVSVGTGAGSGGTWGGVSIGRTIGQGCDSSELRQKRTETRVLLNERGIEP